MLLRSVFFEGPFIVSSFDPFDPVDRHRFFVNSVYPDETAHN